MCRNAGPCSGSQMLRRDKESDVFKRCDKRDHILADLCNVYMNDQMVQIIK